MNRYASIAVIAAIVASANVDAPTAAAQPTSQSTPIPAGAPASAGLGELIYAATQTLAERAGQLTKDKPIVVATVVSIDNLGQASTFGRLASQLVSNRLTQRGYLVRDLNYGRAVVAQPGTGILVLSPDASRISSSIGAQAVLAGTYAVGGREVYLNLRLLKADSGDVLSAVDVVLPLNHNMEPMLVAME